jgi:prepilin-type N-terminal cleavage/methylation domain-containing protein
MTRVRAGFTLLEMMLSVSILLLVFGIAVPFFRTQLQAMDTHAGRYEAQQNARYGAATVDRELRIAGAGLPDVQPMVVQADQYAITFNADLASSVPGSVTAVYYDPDLPSTATTSMTTGGTVSLPLSSTTYPQINYYNGSAYSDAETISFWLAPDTAASAIAGTYALYRRVNAQTPTIVARSLVKRSGDTPTFTYMVLDSTGTPVAIPTSKLPIFHVATHGATNDTGRVALTDSIRLVKLHLVGMTIGPKRDTVYRSVDMSVRLMNSGLLHHTTCGDAPIFGQTVTATYVAGSAPDQITVTWNAATDETGGEKDVERYFIYRRRSAATTFGQEIAIVPAGQSSYLYTDLPSDSTGTTGDWVYGVLAQDCGAQNSSVAISPAVTAP